MSTSLAGRRIVVLGGTGFIGSHLVERLVAEGANVLAVARSFDRLSQLATVRGDCAIALCDLTDGDHVKRTFRMFRPEIVYHLAAHPDGPESFEQFAACLQVNGLGIVNALQAAAACGAELFVYGDSTKVYGNGPVPFRASQPSSPLCSYAVVKTAAWHFCRLAASFCSIQIAAIRPTFVYGPRQNRNIVTHVRECVASGRPVRLQGGAQTRDPLYVSDAVAAFAAVPQHPSSWGQPIPIGGGSEMTVTSLCESVLAAIGGRVPIVEDAEAARPTEVWRSSSDNGDARRLLDWAPRINLSEGLQKTVASWSEAWPGVSTWFSGEPSSTPVHVDPQFLYEIAPDVRFAVLDRRQSVGDRRDTRRGGRRRNDLDAVAEPAFAGVVGGAPLESDTLS